MVTVVDKLPLLRITQEPITNDPFDVLAMVASQALQDDTKESVASARPRTNWPRSRSSGPRDDTHESIRGHRHGRAGHVLCRSRAADGTQQSISTGTVLDVLPTFTIKLAMITIKQVRRMAP